MIKGCPHGPTTDKPCMECELDRAHNQALVDAVADKLPEVQPKGQVPFYVVIAPDGPNTQFVECETADGRSVGADVAGEWQEYPDHPDLRRLGPFVLANAQPAGGEVSMPKKTKANFMGEKISIEEIYDDTAIEDHQKDECSCGCSACRGTGWYRLGRSYKRCCTPCPIHKQ